MYLSRLTLNLRNIGARRDVGRPYDLHRTLMRAMDGAPEEARLLFRIEPERGPEGPIVIAQCDGAVPDWSPLLRNEYLLRADGPKTFAPDIRNGRRLRFRLCANPVKKVEGRRIPLIFDVRTGENVKTYWDWLDRQAGRCGFRVLDALDSPFRTASNRMKKDRYEKHEIPHFGVRFDGILEVEDIEALERAVRRGIGPAKAFGFGLLSLAPV